MSLLMEENKWKDCNETICLLDWVISNNLFSENCFLCYIPSVGSYQYGQTEKYFKFFQDTKKKSNSPIKYKYTILF